MSEIRYDRVHDTHVIIAPERLHRPDCNMEPRIDLKERNHCPFCEGHEQMTPPEIFADRDDQSFANEPGWKTRVVPNLYKAVQIEVPHRHHSGSFAYWEGFGAHEVIIDTPKHHTSMLQYSQEEGVAWLKTLQSRVADLRRDQRIAYISLFKNEGKKAGATQEHAHSQLIGLPIIPKLQRDGYHRSFQYYKQNAQALMQNVIEEEERVGDRIVAKRGAFTAYCPYASAYPFEVMISSKKGLGQIDTIGASPIENLVSLLLHTLKQLDKQLGCFDYNLHITTPPIQHESVEEGLLEAVDDVCRLSIRIMPRIYQHGGFEVSSELMINPVTPEQAAKLLREKMDVKS